MADVPIEIRRNPRFMPRRPRAILAGGCYHVINRGNNRAKVFHDAADYGAFVALIGEAQKRIELDLFAACVMPNHFHLVVRPKDQGDIGRWMHWLQTTHSHRYHLGHETTGRVWQGPYKAFPIAQDGHLLTVLRYVERNPVRAGLAGRARDWRWGSCSWRKGPASRSTLLAEPPLPLPADWDDFVDEPQTAEELEDVRGCVNRQRPYGDESWIRQSPECLEFANRTTRPVGRPKREK